MSAIMEHVFQQETTLLRQIKPVFFLSAFVRSFAICAVLLTLLWLTGCGRSLKPGQEDIPPGLHAHPGMFTDVNPRWSHDGSRIAFLRATRDRKMQLTLISSTLKQPTAPAPAELLCPDRPYSPALQRYNSPDTLLWSPDDRHLAFERIEWFTLEDKERLPGTSLWTLDITTHALQPLAVHSSKYKDLFYYYHAPQWSPDGRYLAFVGEGINGQRALFIRPLQQQSAEVVTPRFDTYQDSDWPVWQTTKPKSARKEGDRALVRLKPPLLAFRQGIVHATATPPTETLRLLSPGSTVKTSSREIWRMRAETLRPFLPDYRPQRAIAPRSGHLVWSPDGRRMAFTLTPNANDYTRYALWVVNSDGTGARRVSPPDGNGYLAPVWIDNSHLGALSPRRSKFDVVTLSLRGAGHKHLLGTIASSDCDWSPDRSQIVYALPPDTRTRPASATTLHLFRTSLSLSDESNL